MKKSFITALVVALLGAMTLGCGRLVGIGSAQAGQEHRPDGRRRRFVQDARLARQAGGPRWRPLREGAADRVRTDGRRVREGAEGDARRINNELFEHGNINTTYC